MKPLRELRCRFATDFNFMFQFMRIETYLNFPLSTFHFPLNQMANGILIVNKPSGWTSQDVAAKLRGVFREKRVGHGGTLDPMATGVLPVFLGRATRGVEFFEHAEKEYIATLRLGLVTDTQDITGTVLQQSEISISQAEIEAVLPQFRGEIEQIPPMYSAVKVGGRRLYEIARKGGEVERKPRAITIFALELLGGEGADWRLRVRCSKGTYIRTLCHDIGQALGCGGCMASLTRTMAGAYTLDQAHSMEEILSAEDKTALLLPVDSLFSAYPSLTVNEPAERKLRNGAAAAAREIPEGRFRVYSRSGEFLLLGEVQADRLTTIKSFFEV